jgi:regulatory protein YycI of two-component signal transduction system YycFG
MNLTSVNFVTLICSFFILNVLHSQDLKEAYLGDKKITLDKGNEVQIKKFGTVYRFLVGDSAWVMINAEKEKRMIYFSQKANKLDSLRIMQKELNNFLKEKAKRLEEAVAFEQSMSDQLIKISKEKEELNYKTIELYKEQKFKRHIYSFILGAVAGAFWADKEDGDFIKVSKVFGVALLSTYISIELH